MPAKRVGQDGTSQLSPPDKVAFKRERPYSMKNRFDPSTEHLWKSVSELRSQLSFLSALEASYPESEIYLVGGAVRDFLIHRETKDYDFLVRRIPAEALGAFLKKQGKVSWVGKQFGVFKFYPKGLSLEEAIDVALPRTEASFSHSGGYRDFDVVSDPALPVEADLGRRDFTINAMAADLKTERIIDPYEGLSDLKAGRLRTVGVAADRFAEDTSRALRGLRFAVQLDLDFEEDTWRALKVSVLTLNAKRDDGTWIVPRETIAKEFIRAMICHPTKAFDLWDESGAFAELLPELLQMKDCPQPENYHSEGDVWMHTRLALSQLSAQAYQEEFQKEYDAETVLAVLFHDIAKPQTIQTPEKDGVDRIRFNKHDLVGAAMTKQIVRRLKLSTFQKGSRYAVDEGALAWLVERHLVLVQGEIDKMRAATIERIFLNPQYPGDKLMQLIYCDGKATVPQDPQTHLSHYALMKARIEKIKALTAERDKIPPPLLSGRELMALLKIPSGPQVGRYLTGIREEQLSGRLSTREEALAWVKQSQKNTRDSG